jgi:hypothetical protein
MGTHITPSRYKDQPAYTLESDSLRAQFLPGIGSKLASLVYKPRGFELLVQGQGKAYLLQPFDGEYVSGECTGCDEMFPTIDACYYDQYPWQGTKMADHGEVWSLPWETKVEEESLHFTVYGVRFPYRLDKWVSFIDANRLQFRYILTNPSDFDFDFLWAAHMMINLEERVELVLPPGVQRIVGTATIAGKFANYGDEFDWPVGTLADGSRKDFRLLLPRSARECYKYYVKGRMPAGWCGLKYHRANFSLALSFPPATVPYLGVLPNSGGWREHYNIFLEPCTASFDRPDAARYRGEVSTVKARSTYEWYLNVTLAEGTAFTAVDEEGQLEK